MSQNQTQTDDLAYVNREHGPAWTQVVECTYPTHPAGVHYHWTHQDAPDDVTFSSLDWEPEEDNGYSRRLRQGYPLFAKGDDAGGFVKDPHADYEVAPCLFGEHTAQVHFHWMSDDRCMFTSNPDFRPTSPLPSNWQRLSGRYDRALAPTHTEENDMSTTDTTNTQAHVLVTVKVQPDSDDTTFTLPGAIDADSPVILAAPVESLRDGTTSVTVCTTTNPPSDAASKDYGWTDADLTLRYGLPEGSRFWYVNTSIVEVYAKPEGDEPEAMVPERDAIALRERIASLEDEVERVRTMLTSERSERETWTRRFREDLIEAAQEQGACKSGINEFLQKWGFDPMVSKYSVEVEFTVSGTVTLEVEVAGDEDDAAEQAQEMLSGYVYVDPTGNGDDVECSVEVGDVDATLDE